MALDDGSIDRILNHVGEKFFPKKLKRRELLTKLRGAVDFYRGYDNESRKGVRTERRKLAKEIAKSAGGLSTLLEDPKHADWVSRRLGTAFLCPPPGGKLGSDIEELPSLRTLIAGIRELESVADRASRAQTGKSSSRELLEVSPLMHLLGCDLARIYKTHFHRKAGRSRSPDGGKPGGPYVRFARAVMQEIGEPTSVHTVEEAIKQAGRTLKLCELE
jgi:hypothetical protein